MKSTLSTFLRKGAGTAAVDDDDDDMACFSLAVARAAGRMGEACVRASERAFIRLGMGQMEWGDVEGVGCC